MSKTRRNRWTSDLTKRERAKLRKKDVNKTKSTKVRGQLEQRRSEQLRRGEVDK
jgi:hypothetical protein